MSNLLSKLLMAEGGDDALHAGDFSPLNYIDFTPAVAASEVDRRKFTVSFWVKPDTLADLAMFSASPFEGATSPRFNFWTNSSGALRFHFNFTGSSWQFFQSGGGVLRANEWQHIHIEFDSTQANNSNRLKIYRNSRIVSLPTFGTVPFNQGQNCVGNNVLHGVGVNVYRPTDANKAFDGQISCFNLCIGTIYSVESFCDIDLENELLTPITEPTVVYGTNGFRVTQNKRIEKDLSGNGNNFRIVGSPLAVKIEEENSIFAEVPNALYSFTSFTFTSAGKSGRRGPNLNELLNSYDTSSFSWLENPEYFTMSVEGRQRWTVPITGAYRFTVVGAAGQNTNGFFGGGAIIEGQINLTLGDVIQIQCGQRSLYNGPRDWQGGGGGTFVVDSNNQPLIIAGGGGTNRSSAQQHSGMDANTGTSGISGSGTSGGTNGGPGAPGGHNAGSQAGAAGFVISGASATDRRRVVSGDPNPFPPAENWSSGSKGGWFNTAYDSNSTGLHGGFGGGGSGGWGGSGGGGGYSGGGNCSNSQYSGGGGSFISSLVSNVATSNGAFSTTGSEPHSVYTGAVSNLNQYNRTSNGYVVVELL